MPVWHVSLSLQRKGRFLDDEARLQRFAVQALRGVGGDHEWWIYGLMLNDVSGAVVGHLRVPVTPAEYLTIAPGLATTDAGETGPQRPRTY
jgi:hypothetical protein